MTFFLNLEWEDGMCGGFGGYALDQHVGRDQPRVAGPGYQAIRCILETLGVDSWEKLPGTLCRIEERGSGIGRIGHIMEDRWFNLAVYMEDHRDA